MNYQKSILRIPLMALAAGLGIISMSAQKAIASEINFGNQINTQAKIGDYNQQLPKWNSNNQYSIAQRSRSLEEFCSDFPLNSRCEGQEAIETTPEQAVPTPKTSEQIRGDNWAISVSYTHLTLPTILLV